MVRKVSSWARRRSRRMLVQAIYGWQLSGNNFATVREAFAQQAAFRRVDEEYFDAVLGAVMRRSSELDDQYSEFLDRAVTALDPIERGILRMATFEFLERLEVPWLVVISEATELAQIFGAQDSFKYINGVLDRVGRKLRPVEAARAGDPQNPPPATSETTPDALPTEPPSADQPPTEHPDSEPPTRIPGADD